MDKKRQGSVFQRSRRQIVAVIMAVFLLLFAITLSAIYVISYQELYQENQDMLEMYVEQYHENGNPSEMQRTEASPPGDSPPGAGRTAGP